MHTKKTISIAYFPDDDFRLGWKKLVRLLEGNRQLHSLLHSQRHSITPKEERIIYSLIGEP